MPASRNCATVPAQPPGFFRAASRIDLHPARIDKSWFRPARPSRSLPRGLERMRSMHREGPSPVPTRGWSPDPIPVRRCRCRYLHLLTMNVLELISGCLRGCRILVSCVTNTLPFRARRTAEGKARPAANVWTLARVATRPSAVLRAPEGRAAQGLWRCYGPCQYARYCLRTVPCHRPCAAR